MLYNAYMGSPDAYWFEKVGRGYMRYFQHFKESNVNRAVIGNKVVQDNKNVKFLCFGVEL